MVITLKAEFYPIGVTVIDYVHDSSSLGNDATEKVGRIVEELDMGFVADLDFTTQLKGLV